ncbi:MAG: hypothetical protein A2430_01850 [Candidatus Liptonbacteria bacterium RIFOXYC1_FULL_36_8]|uniref:Uncharacterized protein n=3 Tax=Candidatus Liptoniibacteriota TaxID=1817909 RepID=A0A1G2CT42_9BACT|nr:MAG: hypothetical protein A2430_01850 [Candidatus Liptonbacteria bacterium RIFOXYC1_FULL_36_8]
MFQPFLIISLFISAFFAGFFFYPYYFKKNQKKEKERRCSYLEDPCFTDFFHRNTCSLKDIETDKILQTIMNIWPKKTTKEKLARELLRRKENLHFLIENGPTQFIRRKAIKIALFSRMDGFLVSAIIENGIKKEQKEAWKWLSAHKKEIDDYNFSVYLKRIIIRKCPILWKIKAWIELKKIFKEYYLSQGWESFLLGNVLISILEDAPLFWQTIVWKRFSQNLSTTILQLVYQKAENWKKEAEKILLSRKETPYPLF